VAVLLLRTDAIKNAQILYKFIVGVRNSGGCDVYAKKKQS
jgi:hypothetical protein